jgi:hypothetical protein
VLLLASLSSADQLYSKNKKANDLYKKGDFQEALKLYDGLSVESPNEPKVTMNKGSALFRLKDLAKAEESYNAAASQCKDKKTLADLYYNLGNIQFKQGEELAGQGKQEAMEKFKGALENYIKSLDIKPGDKDAKWNLQLASAAIKQMQNQQQNQNNQQNKDNKNNQDQNQDQNKNQQQQNKDQEKKDQEKQNKDQQTKDDQQKDRENKQDQKNENKQDQQKPEPTPAQKKEDMKKDDAKKLLELYSDDEHDLNKKPEKKGIAGEKRSEKDW